MNKCYHCQYIQSTFNTEEPCRYCKKESDEAKSKAMHEYFERNSLPDDLEVCPCVECEA